MKNRLDLDFSLATNQERIAFVTNYLNSPQFQMNPPTQNELETIANYVLWGKDPSSGKNVVQEKSIQIETRNSTWASTPVESYDALIESPTFNEAQFTQNSLAPTRSTKKSFSRAEARLQCPPHLLPTLEDLWHRIDILDLQICFYELDHGKRKNPPRPQLLSKFSQTEQLSLHEKTLKWPMYHYLKQRHLLVELRREQYVIRDTYKNSLLPMSPSLSEPESPFDPSIDLIVLPLGLSTPKTSLLFKEKNQLNPFTYSDEDLCHLNRIYWRTRRQLDPIIQNLDSAPSTYVFDFCNESHVISLITKYIESKVDFSINGADPTNTINALFSTLLYYIDFANLDPIQADLIHLKLQKHKINSEIAAYLNKTYHRAYTPNYISTILHQRIVPAICHAASFHKRQVGELFFPEEFKTCSCCGRTLLIDEINFMHRTRSRDGYSNRCKRCDSDARKKRKPKEAEHDT